MFAGSVEIDESGDFGVPLWMMAVFIIGTTLAVVYVPRIVGADAAGVVTHRGCFLAMLPRRFFVWVMYGLLFGSGKRTASRRGCVGVRCCVMRSCAGAGASVHRVCVSRQRGNPTKATKAH